MKSGILFSLLILLITTPLAVAQQRAPDAAYSFADFIEPDFPFITTTINAGTIGPMYPERNVAVRCMILQLGNAAHACFDMDLLRVAATWTGESISMLSMPQVSYHKAGNKKNGIPEILGTPITATGLYPGWQGATPSFTDPRAEGPNPTEAGRGPISPSEGRWHGVYVHDNHAILSYEIKGTGIAERMTSIVAENQTGIIRSIRIDPHNQPLTVILADFQEFRSHRLKNNRLVIHHESDRELTAVGLTSATKHARITMEDEQYAVLHIPPSDEVSTINVVQWRGMKNKYSAFRKMLSQSVLPLPSFSNGGPARWGAPATTPGILGEPQGAFAVDHISLPIPNQWQRNVRVGGLDFFDDGRAAVSTFEGDVWIVSGIDDQLEKLVWKRFASGLSEPMSLSIVDSEIYVFGREGIVHLRDLNNDGEADYYENFSNLPVQTGESREYPVSLHALPEGEFLIAKNSALNAGPNTNPSIMSGLRAGGPHSGSVLKISADGKQIHPVATGFRSPYTGLHPNGLITSSDQQGNYVPSTPIYLVQQDGYYGVPATAHRTDLPQAMKPITWIPHQVDRSGMEQVWVDSDQMGPLNNSLIHLSYGSAAIYKIYMGAPENLGPEQGSPEQGGVAKIPLSFSDPLMKGKMHPVDGRLYLTGFQVWDSDAASISGFSRVRYTGGSLPFPSSLVAGQAGVVLQFDQKLNTDAATNLANYTLERWNYQRTEAYGSGYFKLDGEPGQESLTIMNAVLSEDQHTILLLVDDMQEVMQMGLRYELIAANGDSLNEVVHFTINELSKLDTDAYGFPAIETIARVVQPSAPLPVQTSMPTIDKGRQIYQQTGCVACHSDDGTTEGRSGPTFKGLYGSQRTFIDGTSARADEAYILESVQNPSARVIAGKEVEMPSYIGILDDDDMASLLLFIKSLD
ncbi:MAG: DUF6797 domain-containing protein [Rhodothermales bacterium]